MSRELFWWFGLAGLGLVLTLVGAWSAYRIVTKGFSEVNGFDCVMGGAGILVGFILCVVAYHQAGYLFFPAAVTP